MITGIFHEGSGLGDQLFRYVTVRTLAEEKGLTFSMLSPQNFKGTEFMSLNYPTVYKPAIRSLATAKTWFEKDVRDTNRIDIRSYDPEVNFVVDNTILDGSFEDDKYWGHNLENVNKWLAVEPLDVSDDTCIVGFRGGEYATQPDLFLPPLYFGEAMQQLPATIKKYEIHTDDPNLASTFFVGSIFSITDNQPISHSKHSNMGFNWRSARYAKNAIIPNSAFFILPRLLKHWEDPTAVTIAPRGWSRRNLAKGTGPGDFIWARPACFYRPFTYI